MSATRGAGQLPASDATVVRFRQAAARFCASVRTCRTLSRATLLLRCVRLLPRLLAEAMDLPRSSPPADALRSFGYATREALGQPPEPGEIRIPAIYRRANTPIAERLRLRRDLAWRFGRWDAYSEVFDPYDPASQVTTSLSDAIADIYTDLRVGLVLIRSPAETDQRVGVYQWRFDAIEHWGPYHAPDAIRALFFALRGESRYL